MPASRPSSEARRGGGALARRCGRILALWVPLALGGSGCVTVSPAEKEYLADPAMTFGAEGKPAAHAAHVYANREGSFGARGMSGGGCGCN